MLVNTKEMLLNAYDGGYAIGGFNINNMETIQAIVETANKLKSPVILQVSEGTIRYAKLSYLMNMIQAADDNSDIPIAIHLDHGSSYSICKECIDAGFTSVMIDGSRKSFSENINMTKEVVKYAHERGVTVEGELGRIEGINLKEGEQFTDPDQVEEFVQKTGVDSLAIAIGTSHGAYKFKMEEKPELRFDILEEIMERMDRLPIVLHGASSVMQEYVEKIKEYGGEIGNPIGIPEELLRKASKMAVCKINIDSDLRLAATAALRESIFNLKSNIDPRQFLDKARENMAEVVSHKIEDVLGSKNKI